MLAHSLLRELQQQLGKQVGGISHEALACLEAYPWPGNVRELQNELKRMLVLAEDGSLGAELLSPRILHCASEEQAEDLGIITPEVETLRDRWGLPGMKILQFAFDGGADNLYLPHNHPYNAVVYTGTHDNDTTLGWFQQLPPDTQAYIREYLATDDDMPWALIRTALASTARLAVIPMQDLLGLNSEARMNTPSITEGNWRWRFQWQQVTPELAPRLARLCQLYGRVE